LVAAR